MLGIDSNNAYSDYSSLIKRNQIDEDEILNRQKLNEQRE